MKYLALVFFAAVLAAIAGQGCAKQDAVIAKVTVDLTFDALDTAYKTQQKVVQARDCQDYYCESVYNCPSLSQCPAQQDLTKAWEPVWTSYDQIKAAVELGDSDAARAGYCKLRVTAGSLGVKLPLPGYDCQ